MFEPKKIYLDLNKYFKLTPCQDYMLPSKARWKFLRCGRRFGKGRFATPQIVTWYLELLMQPRPKHLIPNIHIWVMVPTMSVVHDTWAELKELIPSELIEFIWEADLRMKLAGGGVLEVKSADIRATQQATGLDILWITEADKIEKRVWDDLVPMLVSPDRAGYAIVESIPYNETGWFHELVEEGLNNPSEELEAWDFTSYANPMIDHKRLDWQREHVYDEVTFAREYLAVPSSGIEAAFPRWKLRQLPEDWERPRFTRRHEYRLGVDLAKELHKSVVSSFCIHTRNIEDIIGFQTNWEDTRKVINEWSKSYKHPPIYIDATGVGNPVIEELRKDYPDLDIHPVVFTSGERHTLLANLAFAIEKGDIHYPQYQPLMKELAKMKRTHKYPYDEWKLPGKRSPDHVMSVALAYTKERPGDYVGVKSMGGLRNERRLPF